MSLQASPLTSPAQIKIFENGILICVLCFHFTSENTLILVKIFVHVDIALLQTNKSFPFIYSNIHYSDDYLASIENSIFI